MNRKVILLLMCILALSLGIRLFQMGRCSAIPPTGDSPGYDSIAWNLVEGNGYKMGYGSEAHYTAVRGPSYVLFLAAIYRLTNHSVAAARVVQILLDLVACFLVFKICLLVLGRYDYALVCALIYGIYPPNWKVAPVILTETFVNLMFILVIYGMLSFYRSGKRSALIVCGLAMAVGALSKPVMLAFPVIMAFAAWGTLKSRKQEIVLPVVCLILAGVFFIPWWVRNATVFHAFVPTLTTGGVTFWLATSPSHGQPIYGLHGPDVPDQVRRATASLDEYHLDKWLFREGIRVIKSNPRRYAVLSLKKVVNLWFGGVFEGGRHPGRFTMCLTAILIALAAYGIAAVKPPSISLRLLAILVVCYTCVHVVYSMGDPRYAVPVLAYMFAFSAAGVVSAYEAIVACRRFGAKSKPL